MPHSGTPIEMVKFLFLGRRKAREYLAKRGKPWPPINFEPFVRIARESNNDKP